jgi:hypothetical protein
LTKFQAYSSETNPSRRRGRYIRIVNAKVQLQKKSLVVSLKVFDGKSSVVNKFDFDYQAVERESANSQLSVVVVRSEKLLAEAGSRYQATQYRTAPRCYYPYSVSK